MHRQGRNAASSGGSPAGFNDPFGGFGGGFGGFGFGQSMIRDFFGHDPFDDPFFTRPFGSGFGFGSHLVGSRPEGGFLEQRPFNLQQEARRGPIIEEIDGDHSDGEHRRRDEPIVEHPDDDLRADARSSRNLRQQGPGPLTNQRNGSSNFQSYSFQSSSMSFGGPDGKYYVSSTKRSAGPNGVVHEEHHEKDSAAGQESHRVSKGIYDKGHSVTRKRNAEGREETLETLHNLEEAEASEFDKRWEAEAEAALPGWSKSKTTRALGGNGSGSSNAAMRALPGGPSGPRAATNNNSNNNAASTGGKRTNLGATRRA